MWNTKGKNSVDLTMTEGDFGVEMTVEIDGFTISSSDTVELTVKKTRNGKAIIEKTFEINEDNTIDLVFTEDETDDLKVGTYLYRLDIYRNGLFMYCVVNNAKLKVEDKI